MVALGDTLFRSPSLAVAGQVLEGFSSGLARASTDLANVAAPPAHHAWIAFPAFILAEVTDAFRRRNGLQLPLAGPLWARWSTYACITVCFVFVVLLLLARNFETNPFVYELF
jgi:hypothetical protein